MKVVRRYTVCEYGTRFTRTGGSELEQLDLEVLEKEFDTEDQAIAWAYTQNKWVRYVIVPVISFDNH
jgi:hypothetical protein